MTKRGIPKGPLGKFLLTDTVVVLLALGGAFAIRFQEIRPENLNIYIPLLIPIVLVRLITLFSFRLYDFSRPLTYFDVVYFSGWAMVVAHSIESLMLFYIGTFWEPGTALAEAFTPFLLPSESPEDPRVQISRYIIVLNFLLSWGLVAGWRVLYLQRRRRWAYDRTRLLIVGAGPLGESVRSDIERYSQLGHEVVGIVDDDVDGGPGSSELVGRMSELSDLVPRLSVDEIIITSSGATRRDMLEILTRCRATGARVHVLPELYEITIGQVNIGQVAGIPLITLGAEPMTDWQRALKRTFDVVVAGCALIVFLPIGGLIAIAVAFTSRGPVFYTQERVGRNGLPFPIIKFRTMVVDAESDTGPVHAHENDPRVTRIGRLLRMFHLDELPQLFNVLRGDMSLVGPRPERPHFVERFAREEPAYRLRERVRPGMTGLAQIHGFYNSPTEHKLRYDLAYINNMSLLLDIKILFNTIRVSLSGHKVLS